MVLTTAWAVTFTVAAIALTVVLHVSLHATATVVAVKVLSFVVPAAFTAWYPNHVRRVPAR
ncbi:hypothetical protein ABZW11_16205 [Nonomuraea sp. NPDC004580]|uniref:hypothetical protein n=1 Tax=Nonomuraea sp. NPDC004580 TaxID=3154552 RepID=UPI0033BAFB13